MLRVIGIHSSKKYEEYLKKISRIKANMKCGILSGATYPDGLSVATVAYINENGAMGNPRRPFMHRTLEQNQEKWAKGIVNNLTGNVSVASVQRAYEFAGMTAKGDMVETIKKWSPNDPRANSPATIARKAAKGRKGKNTVATDPTQVLIDTGTMISSIDYEVET